MEKKENKKREELKKRFKAKWQSEIKTLIIDREQLLKIADLLEYCADFTLDEIEEAEKKGYEQGIRKGMRSIVSFLIDNGYGAIVMKELDDTKLDKIISEEIKSLETVYFFPNHIN